jgi:glycosyltransferase involved in cell wall biosynthesis
MAKKLKVALVTGSDPHDHQSFSGTMFFMTSAIRKYFGDVDYIGQISAPPTGLEKIISKLSAVFSGGRTGLSRHPEASKTISKTIHKKLICSRYDLVFAPVASMEIAFLETDVPIVYHSDATFTLLHRNYSKFPGFAEHNARIENQYEQAAINRAGLLVYPSEWAATSAIQDYGAKESRVRVIPYGANIEKAPLRDEVINKPIGNPIQLLFYAKEWERKGGPIAYDTLEYLLDKGVETELIVCGLKPPKKYRRTNVRYYEYLDKSKQKDREQLESILRNATLLLLPTRADCSPTVLCEANAYGLPVFSTRVGGIPSIIENGINGCLLPADADGKDFAEKIKNYVRDKERYDALNVGARNRYETTLNWDTWGQKVREAVKDVMDI